MTAHERRMRALEMTTRQRSLVSVKRWWDCLSDCERASVTAQVSDLDAEIFTLLLVVSEADIGAIAAKMGHPG